MKTIFLVFDQLPHKKDGGLIATYARFVQEFSHDFEIKIVSIFQNGGNDIKEFNNIPVINFSDFNIDNRFYRCFSYLHNMDISRFIHSLISALYFFIFIPFAKRKSKKTLKDSIVIVSSPAAAIFVSSKVKYILEIHTKYEYFWGNSLLGRAQIALASKPSFVLFRNKADAEKARHLFPAGYIYNGFDDALLPIRTNKERRPSSALFVGNLASHKNPMMLLRCAREVKKQISDFTLDIYGSGELEDSLKQAIVTMNLEDTVFMKGFLDDKSIYSQYELFWFTSKLDGFGLVLIESMANGTPIITTNWGDGVFEVVKNGETGYIVNTEAEFVQKSIDLFLDQNKRKSFGINAKNDFKKRFTAKKNKEQWLKIIKEVYSL